MQNFKLSILGAILAFSTFGFAMDVGMQPKSESQYLEMMSQHHEGAIEMAKMAEQKSSSKDVRALAKKIEADQTKEIKQMRGWKSSWYPKEEMNHEMPKMDMAKLASSQGKEFDKEFLTLMTEHHKGGVEMMKLSMPFLNHKEAKTMAKMGIKKQSDEIKKMSQIQKTIE